MSLQSKGQTFSTDFMIACVIFILAFSILIVYWGYSSKRIEETKETSEMIEMTYLVSHMAFREGTPKYWNSTNVIDIGLQNNRRLNETKMNILKELGYEEVKKVIGVEPYEFRFRVWIPGEEHPILPPVAYINHHKKVNLELLEVLNESGYVWDLYWGCKDEEPPTNITARHVYNTSEIDGNKKMFKKIVENLDEYNSIISEEAFVDDIDLTDPEKQALRDWVEEGHTYFHIFQSWKMLRIFGLNPEAPDDDIGIVKELDPMIKELDVDDTVVFQREYKTYDIATSPLPLKSIMVADTDRYNCLFCRWTLENGSVYSIPEVADPVSNLIPSLKILGFYFVFGKNPTDAENIVKIDRFGILDSRIANIEVMVWK